MSQNYRYADNYGVSLRHWGSRKDPLPFRIIVSDMKDVIKHKPTRQPQSDVLMSSSLAGGIVRLRGGHYGR